MPELPDLVHVEAGCAPRWQGKRIAAARTGDPTVLRVMVSEPFPAVLVGRTARRASSGAGTSCASAGRRSGDRRQRDAGRALQADRAGPTENAKKDPRALGLALAFDDAPELQYLDDKRMGKVYVARARPTRATIPCYGQLGMDMLSPAFTREAFGKLVAKRRDQVRAFLMDKRALASVGNAYADEILFAARLHPKTFCNKLAPAELDALYAGDRPGAARRDRRDPPARRADRHQGARLPQGARPRRQAVPGLRHHHPRRPRRRRRRLLLPALSARDAQAVRQLERLNDAPAADAPGPAHTEKSRRPSRR